MKRLLSVLFASAAIGIVAVPAEATLFDRGGGLIYDNDLDITWLQDANYAMTSGYDADGKMAWSDAVTWADNLVYGGYSDWRLPDTNPATPEYVYGYDGTTSVGWNITSSEMGHLYYTELGNLADWDASGAPQPGGGLVNTGPFTNLVHTYYWSGTEYAFSAWPSAWDFNFGSGLQSEEYQVNVFYALAVRPGDSAAASVPEPGTMMLMGSGLIGLIAARKRFSRRHG